MLLKAGSTCWRTARAGRASAIVDMDGYFAAAKSAMRKARRSIHFLNWAFDPDTAFHPKTGGATEEEDRIGPFLKRLACDNPELDVRILCWKSALPVAATQRYFTLRARMSFHGTPVKLVLDGRLPRGACHHQKMIVIDDTVAFCGSGDIGPDRWDTPHHLDNDPRREKTPSDNKCFDSRHEVMSVLDGDAARTLGELFRERWLRATGEALAPAGPPVSDPWPPEVPVDFNDVAVGISRTQARWRRWPEMRDNEALYLASFAAAKRCIYLENQYFTSPIMAEALAARLSEPEGPEVILVSTQHSPSYFDQMTMDRTRSMFVKRLRAADGHARLRVYSPVTSLGRTVIVHAKLAIIDDRLLRIGSCNMNNRSSGFDTELDISLEAGGPADPARARIRALRIHLIAHWLGCSEELVETTLAQEGSCGRAIEALRGSGHCRLRPIQPQALGPLASFIAAFHLGDPISPGDDFRPWKRRRQLDSELAKVVERLRQARLETPIEELSDQTI